MRMPGRYRPLFVGLVVGVAQFAATAVALRALIGATGRDGAGPVLSGLVAVLAFPLFYTPVPAHFAGRVYTGWYVAALNAVLWGCVAAAVVAWRRRRVG